LVSFATFKKYNQRYEEKYAAFEVAKKELEKNWIPKKLLDANVQIKWELDYSSGIMAVTILDDNFDIGTLGEACNV